MRNRCVALAAAAAFSVGTAGWATMIGDFEGGNLAGWSGGWDGGIISAETTGATSGTGSLGIMQASPGGWAWAVQFEGLQDIAANPYLSLDVTWVSSEWQPQVPGANEWVQMNEVFINSDGASGGQQFGPSFITDPASPAFPGSWDPTNWGAQHTRTLVWDLSSYDPTGATWMQILVSTNMGTGYDPPGTAGTFYIDNVQLIPEPGSLALLGLGALLVSLRRRRG